MPRRHPPRRSARRAVLAALLPVLVVAGCTVGPSTRPAVVQNDAPAPTEREREESGQPLPPLGEPGPSTLDWSDCASETRDRLGGAAGRNQNYECAYLTTTLDPPGMPGQGLTRMSVLKAGNGPVPLVVVNDVDGEPGTLYAARLAASLPDALLDRFSLIGVDRRGTGGSDAVRCIPPSERATLLDSDPSAGIDRPLDAARTAGQQCAIALEDEQGAIDSRRTTSDLDTLRESLGMDRLHALGHGEGSRVLAMYSARFPGKTGRMVLDGMPDPSDDHARVLGGVAGGAEATLDAAGTELGRDLRGDVTALTERLGRGAPLTSDGYRLTPQLALRAVLVGLADRERWSALADAVAAARSGDPGPLFRFVRPHVVEDQVSAARLDGTIATRCNDTATRLPADRLASTARDLAREHPVFGATVAQELVWCSPWPTRSGERGAIGSEQAPPMVVVSTETDPVTPGKGTIRAADQMPSAVHVAWKGAGHGALSSSCVTDAARAFLVDGDVPRDGTLCPA
ncbi:TAP-like protein [Prauserella aidingensis]|uniref:alpha/beta hydrolase n=1 Tax=Prauserella aidingensis TaxID=387890 RepID=UPI0020A339F7|nr:alpha/beta hydrolase [Prauserella aidingensis]MCP2254623.1 TAP-like protein [Prauserella aidingensis]